MREGRAASNVVTGSRASNTARAVFIPIELRGSWVTGTVHAVENGGERSLVVVVAREGSSLDLTNVAYGTQHLTQAVEVETTSGGTRARVEIWTLLEAGIVAATDSNIVLTWAGGPGPNVMVDSAFFSSVDQSNPVGAVGSNSNIGDTPTTISTPALGTNDGDMAVYGVQSGNAISFTPLNGFTEGNDQTVGGTTTLETGYKQAVGANETPSANADSAPLRLAIAGAVLNVRASTLPKADVSGSVTPTADEADIITGGETIVVTLTNDTWDAPSGPTTRRRRR